jgi:putative transposase
VSREITLSTSETEYLQSIVNKGKHSARKIKRARIVLLLSAGMSPKEVASKVDVVLSTVYEIWNRYLEEGRDAGKAIEEKPRSGQPAKLTDEVKAQITAIACSDPPEGNSYWTLQMICNRIVELGHVEKISTEPVRKYLKKNSLSPGRRSAGSSAK